MSLKASEQNRLYLWKSASNDIYFYVKMVDFNRGEIRLVHQSVPFLSQIPLSRMKAFVCETERK